MASELLSLPTARGGAWGAKDEYDKEIADYTEALAIDPKNANAYIGRGMARFDKGEHDQAFADFNRSLAVDPKCANACVARGCPWGRKGEYDKAIADYTIAVGIDPKGPSAYNSLAWIYATCPDAKYRDGDKAVENANKANQLQGGKCWGYLATLAAAYAESGDFVKAQEWQGKAIELAPEFAKPDYRSRLELYKQGKPYREQPVKK
jgi:tetratricopeptide (TPR) repeat protein